LPQPLLLLALDGVMDPRNLGACLRSADAAGLAPCFAEEPHRTAREWRANRQAALRSRYSSCWSATWCGG
jgi:tRNA G18 (ribose-2'-O)-methylase SpoU